MRQLNAVLWDVDGTLAETERDGHRVAFNLAFEALGLPWRWDVARYGELLTVTGGRERLQHDMASRTDAPVTARERLMLAEELHRLKNHHYAERVRSGAVVLRPGVVELMGQCAERGVRMALATTTSRMNVEALLRVHLGSRWASWFEVIVCGEDVRHKKPDPEVYHQVLAGLKLRPLQALAIEDSPMGAAAARAAELPVVVTRSAYFEQAIFDGATAIGPGLHQRRGWRPALSMDQQGADDALVGLDDLIDWHAQMDSVSQFS
ncbi:HAD-IA family hydrolase [uncultured Sphaerotilus sp.]|uniref:HAD-IA family hydrolase n=1 Tax=uncultured Sphaerotilus sp. TaxID=474984 RepID=UPI0030CA1448